MGFTDRVLFLAIAGVGMAARLWWYSGLGLGDDQLLRRDIATIVNSGTLYPSPNSYRFTWWLPTGLTCRLFGLGETGFILPILAFDLLGMWAVFLLGRRLFGRVGGYVALLLLVVTPLDFAWSTMLASDIIVSACSSATMLFVLQALDTEPTGRRRAWRCAAVALWLSFHAKVSAVLLAPALVVAALVYRAHLDRSVLTFVRWATVLFAGSTLVSWIFTGDPIAPLTSELHHQGLTKPDALIHHRLTADVFWSYPRWLFRPDHLGDLVFSVHAWCALALALLAWPLGLRTSIVAWAWLLVVFLGMQFNLQRFEDAWVAGFRNIRHAHVFVHPLTLVLTGYLCALGARWRGAAIGIVAGLVAYGGWASVATASRTSPIFRQMHELTTLLAQRKPEPIASDFQTAVFMTVANLRDAGWTPRDLDQNDVAKRRATLATMSTGLAVTGGGREPYYGCVDCIPRADELEPGAWRLVREWPMPLDPPPWWPEPLRLWQRVTPPA